MPGAPGASGGGFSFGNASALAQNGSGAAPAAGDDDAPDENPEDKVSQHLQTNLIKSDCG